MSTIRYTKQYNSPPLQGVRVICSKDIPDDQVADRIATVRTMIRTLFYALIGATIIPTLVMCVVWIFRSFTGA